MFHATHITRIFTLFCLTMLPLSFTHAEQITVQLRDNQGAPVPNVVVTLTPQTPTSIPSSFTQQNPAIMDQIDKQFVPHILVVPQGSFVAFPNSDSIQHHVYSFSKAKPFELKLYSGRPPHPLAFEQSGEVVMGCNIHDWMLGYVYVVDTPFYGKTNARGELSLTSPAGSYQLKIWNPLIDSQDINLQHSVTLPRDGRVSIALQHPTLPALDEFEQSDEFDDY